jgi:hypothetical protein
MRTDLLTEIREFLSRTGTKPYDFGIEAAMNGQLVDRLEKGGRVWPETEISIRAFLKANEGRTDPVRADRAKIEARREAKRSAREGRAA